MTAAIKVEGLSKSYRITHESRERYTTFRDAISSGLRQFVAGGAGVAGSNSKRPRNAEDFWAVKDVCFEIQPGERVGIIGRNGAGKSTLLKLLSRITEPTRGRAVIKGRVASLLEVGTGFHSELTGRENIFLNGAILGMSKADIARQFDEIVDFAEIETFLDTPVKRYSSGMYVRLAFAVSAHLQADILIVDEVLAVGDHAFQEKCLSKMRDVTSTGRTILFVSHNMGAIRQLCQRGLLLESGRVALDGDVDAVTDAYEHLNTTRRAGDARKWDRSGSGRVVIEEITAEDESVPGSPNVPFGGVLKILVAGKGGDTATRFSVAIQLSTAAGLPVVYGYDQFLSYAVDANSPFKLEAAISNVALMPGTYFVNVWLGQAGVEDFDYVKFAAPFEVVQNARIRITAPISQSLGLVISELNLKRVQ